MSVRVPPVKRSPQWFIESIMKRSREYRSGKRQEGNEHEMERIEEMAFVTGANDVVKHCAVIDPYGANNDEANRIGEIVGPRAQEFWSQRIAH